MKNMTRKRRPNGVELERHIRESEGLKTAVPNRRKEACLMRFERRTGRKTPRLGGWWLAMLYGGTSVVWLLLGSGHAQAQSNIALNAETTSDDTSVTTPNAYDTSAEPPPRDEPQGDAGDAQTAPTQTQTP